MKYRLSAVKKELQKFLFNPYLMALKPKGKVRSWI